MTKWLKPLLALMALAASMMGQTVAFYSDRALGVNPFTPGTGGSLSPLFLSYSQVRVCSLPLTLGTPCPTPAAITDIFGNAIAIVGGNFGQLTTDVVGRFSFGCTPGNYQVQVAATGSNTPATAYPITCALSQGSPIAAAGIFSGAHNEVFEVQMGGCNSAVEALRFGGANMANAMGGCVAMPASATVLSAAAVAGFASTAGIGSTSASGGYFQSICLATDTKCVGALFRSGDIGGLAGTGDTELFGFVSQVYQNSPAASYQVLQGGSITGILSTPPAFATALIIQGVGSPWPTGITFVDGGNTVSIKSGSTCGSGSCASQPIKFHGMTAGVADTDAIIYSGKGVPSAGTCAVGKSGLYIREDGAQNTTTYQCDSTTGTWVALNVP